MSYAFVFRAYPDVDHMVPLVWRLLEEGEQVHGIVSPGYDHRGDYRLRFLSRYPRFQLHEIQPPAAGAGRVATAVVAARGSIRWTLPWTLAFMARRNVTLVAVEWGFGLREGYDRLGSPRGALAVLRSVAGSLRRVRDPQQVRANFIVAARLLRRPTLCLPHGLSIKLGLRRDGGKLLAGPYDWRDRNRFAAYVLNTEHHREWFIERAQGDPEVVQTWGSLRWAPEWFELNRELAPAFTWPSEPWRRTNGGPPRLKVAFMVPKWANHVDREATLELVKRLQAVDEISLSIKGHPRREDGSADPLRDDSDIDWTRIHDVTNADSVSVIAAADVVVDVGSSIGIEVVMQRKVLVNPSYIHDFWTFFDEVADSCVVAGSADDVVRYLLAHVSGSPHEVSASAYAELLRRGVYGSRNEPYDVIGAYCERVRALARTEPDKRS
jgi:hypothetical protein